MVNNLYCTLPVNSLSGLALRLREHVEVVYVMNITNPYDLGEIVGRYKTCIE